MSLIYFIYTTFNDALFFGYWYMRRIKANINNVGWFNNFIFNKLYDKFHNQIKWLFAEYSIIITVNGDVKLDERNVFRYRVLVQWLLDGIFIYLIYRYGIGFTINVHPIPDWLVLHLEFICTLIGLFLMVKEYGYYILLGQNKLLKEFELYKVIVFWLNRFYFAGSYIFHPFTVLKFKICFYTGVFFILIPYFIKLIQIILW